MFILVITGCFWCMAQWFWNVVTAWTNKNRRKRSVERCVFNISCVKEKMKTLIYLSLENIIHVKSLVFSHSCRWSWYGIFSIKKIMFSHFLERLLPSYLVFLNVFPDLRKCLFLFYLGNHENNEILQFD